MKKSPEEKAVNSLFTKLVRCRNRQDDLVVELEDMLVDTVTFDYSVIEKSGEFSIRNNNTDECFCVDAVISFFKRGIIYRDLDHEKFMDGRLQRSMILKVKK